MPIISDFQTLKITVRNMNTQHPRLNRFTSPLKIGEIFFASLYRQIYLAAEHRRDFGCFIIQTELPRRWTSARFRLFYYTDRITSPLNIGEIWVASIYRQVPCNNDWLIRCVTGAFKFSAFIFSKCKIDFKTFAIACTESLWNWFEYFHKSYLKITSACLFTKDDWIKKASLVHTV